MFCLIFVDAEVDSDHVEEDGEYESGEEATFEDDEEIGSEENNAGEGETLAKLHCCCMY